MLQKLLQQTLQWAQESLHQQFLQTTCHNPLLQTMRSGR